LIKKYVKNLKLEVTFNLVRAKSQNITVGTPELWPSLCRGKPDCCRWCCHGPSQVWDTSILTNKKLSYA